MAVPTVFSVAYNRYIGKERGDGLKDVAKLFNNTFSWFRYLKIPIEGTPSKVAEGMAFLKNVIGCQDLFKKSSELREINWTHWSTGMVAASKIGKVSEWCIHLNEVTQFARSLDLFALSKEGVKKLNGFNSLAVLVKGSTGLYTEVVKASLDEVDVGRGNRARRPSDWVATAIKIAMNISFLAIACMGLISLLSEVPLFASLAKRVGVASCFWMPFFATTATVAGIFDHFVAQLYVNIP